MRGVHANLVGFSSQMKAIKPAFVGCDGEGLGEGGRHRYALFRMGDRELCRRGRRLATPELLDFICSHPSPTDILVAYAFEYDVSMILRDVRHERLSPSVRSPLERVLAIDDAWSRGDRNPYAQGGWVWLTFDPPGLLKRTGNKRQASASQAGGELARRIFGVQYLPRKYLKVCRGEAVTGRLSDGTTWELVAPVEGSARMIANVFDFFGQSFVAALQDWRIGTPAEVAFLARMKARRARFSAIDAKVKAYCALECRLLGDLMGELRTMLENAGVPPLSTWTGAGKIAAALLDKHGVTTAKAIKRTVPEGALALAHAAYYAGRFETTREGRIKGPVFAHDQNSAFAAEMMRLPCLEHGKWRKASGAELGRMGAERIFVAPARFDHFPGQFLCGLPWRSDDGLLSWPRQGAGVYWSEEIRSAERLGAEVKLGEGFAYEARCDCKPLAFVESYYAKRKRLGPRGQPIKKGLQAIYGKFAERIGQPKWGNPIWAGLITARVRARLNDLIAKTGPRNVVMIAADAIYTADARAPVDEGRSLGQWRVSRHRSLFIVRPGLYWTAAAKGRRLKTRGLSRTFFEPRIGAFEKAWGAYARRGEKLADPPAVKVDVTTFMGLRLAFRRGEPDQACRWKRVSVACNFDWHDKRSLIGWDGEAMILGSLAGSASAWSAAYDDQGGRTEFDRKFAADRLERDLRMLAEALPDPIDLSPPMLER